MIKKLIILFILTYINSVFAEEKTNVLIISLCSTSYKTFRNKPGLTPNLNKFLNNSTEVTNAHTHLPWANASSVLSIHQQRIQKMGYHIFQKNYQNTPFLYYVDEDSNLAEISKTFVNNLSNVKKPFFSLIHIRHNHRPFFLKTHEDLNKNLALFSGSSESKKMLKNPNELSTLARFVLFPDPREYKFIPLLRNKIIPAKDYEKYNPSDMYGLVFSKEELQKWQASKNYQKELKLIKEAYEFRLNFTDKEIQSLFDTKMLNQKLGKTLILAVGDHGEALMEHNNLLAGNNLYDEETHFFFGANLATLPIKNTTQINAQKYSTAIAEIIFETIDPRSTSSFEEFKTKEEVVFTKNCKGDKVSIRQKNQWKLIYNLSDNSYELYDLKNDPKELKNIFSFQHPKFLELNALRVKKEGEPSLPHTQCN